MFVLFAISWRFLKPYFLIAMMILMFWWSKKETKRLILRKYSSGAIWLKYGQKKTGGIRNFSTFSLHRNGLGSWWTGLTVAQVENHLIRKRRPSLTYIIS